jgi:hypothetical protein
MMMNWRRSRARAALIKRLSALLSLQPQRKEQLAVIVAAAAAEFLSSVNRVRESDRRAQHRGSSGRISCCKIITAATAGRVLAIKAERRRRSSVFSLERTRVLNALLMAEARSYSSLCACL